MKRRYFKSTDFEDSSILAVNYDDNFVSAEKYCEERCVDLNVYYGGDKYLFWQRIHKYYEPISKPESIKIDTYKFNGIIACLRESEILTSIEALNQQLPYPMMVNYIQDCNGNHSLFFCKENLSKTRDINKGSLEEILNSVRKLLRLGNMNIYRPRWA